MGWTSYNGMNAQEAVAWELRGLDILAKSGAWYLCRNDKGTAFLVYAMSSRENGQVFIKLVDSSMGPVATPPQTLFRRYLRESQGQTFGTYEQDWIHSVEAEYAQRKTAPSLKPGNVFTLSTPLNFTDGVTEDTFVFIGKFRARRVTDNVGVRLARDFRKHITDVAPARFTA